MAPRMAPQVNDTDLVDLALRGLAGMYDPHTRGFVQTLRGVPTPSGPRLRPEGASLRYSAIALLGLAHADADAQSHVLGGGSVHELTDRLRSRAAGSHDPGAVALVCWAAAETSSVVDRGLFDQLWRWVRGSGPLAVVDLSWILTASVCAHLLEPSEMTQRVRDEAAARLLRSQGGPGLFPHVDQPATQNVLRRHVGSFADQIYPVQALARLAGASGRTDALLAANRCAARICELQGGAGQWWWHYDVRDGSVVEGYPVYSVHQHAMAPMVLFDLVANGGDDHTTAVTAGLDWLTTHPEVFDELVDNEHGVIWRKVGRREPPRAARSIGALTTALRPGLHLPGVGRAFPTTWIDRECRPYELGWLLYAWLPRPGHPDRSPLSEGHAGRTGDQDALTMGQA